MEILKQKLLMIFNSNSNTDSKLQLICTLLKKKVPYYDWVGFYFINEDKKELKLAQFAGKSTEHTIIPFGKGICGQVALSNQNFIVSDVEKQDNYISCGIEVKSEIVIPIFKNGKNIGQIDIDSHTIDPFSNKDIELLEFICQKISEFI